LTASLVWLAIAWLAYALLHSILASFAVKDWVARRWPSAVPYYRLAFNIIAAVTALPLAWLLYAIPGEPLWRWSGTWWWLGNGLALAAVAGFFVSTRAYDMGEFLGLRQIREHDHATADRERFTLSFFHRYVRHPWYFFGLVIVWTRDMNRAYRMGRGIQAGRVWTNCYHHYPAHAAFGGYKKSGVGRENHKMMLDHYQQTKNMLVSYDINPLGFF